MYETEIVINGHQRNFTAHQETSSRILLSLVLPSVSYMFDPQISLPLCQREEENLWICVTTVRLCLYTSTHRHYNMYFFMSPFISKSPNLCFTYSSVMMTASPALSGASKETSSTILSMTVCRRLAPMFSTVLFVFVDHTIRKREGVCV